MFSISKCNDNIRRKRKKRNVMGVVIVNNEESNAVFCFNIEGMKEFAHTRHFPSIDPVSRLVSPSVRTCERHIEREGKINMHKKSLVSRLSRTHTKLL